MSKKIVVLILISFCFNTAILMLLISCEHKQENFSAASDISVNNTDLCVGNSETNVNTDTIWADNHRDWEIKNPYIEDGKTVLYRSCTFVCHTNDRDNEIISYYLYPRNTKDYENSLTKMQSITAKHFLDDHSESGVSSHAVQMNDVPLHWYPIRRYKGKFYLFHDNNCGLYLSEKAFIPACWDYWVYQLEKTEKLADGSYKISYLDDNDGNIHIATMFLIDKSTGLYRFDSDLNESSLYTTDEHLTKYDIIEIDGYPIMGTDRIEFED